MGILPPCRDHEKRIAVLEAELIRLVDVLKGNLEISAGLFENLKERDRAMEQGTGAGIPDMAPPYHR